MFIVSRLALPVLALVCSCRSCPGGAPEPPAVEEEGEELVAGKCRNENVEGECRLFAVQPQSKEYTPGPSDTVVCRVDFEIVLEDREVIVTLGYFRVPDGYEKKLTEYYEENSPAHCEAYIVWPPCNPQATTVGIDVEPPEFAKPERL